MPKVNEQSTPAGRLKDFRVPIAKAGAGRASALVSEILSEPAPKTTIEPLDVTITEAAAFVETAGFSLGKGIYLVKPRYSWSADSTVTAAHGGLYYATDRDVLVEFSAYYNNGATSGSPTPDAKLLLVPAELTGVTFYVSWPGDSTTGSLTDVEIDLYLLGGVA